MPIARSLYDKLGPSTGEGGAGGAADEAGGASSGSSTGDPSAGAGGEDDAYLRYLYESIVLNEGYEAMFGRTPGDAQACYGDSGSPIIRADAKGNLVAYGVVSAGIGSNQLVCDYGGIDAVIGPEVKTFLSAAQKWVDPCKGVSVEGTCSGKTAQRCTSPLEGPRRLVKFNCGSLGRCAPFNATAPRAAAIREHCESPARERRAALSRLLVKVVRASSGGTVQPRPVQK